MQPDDLSHVVSAAVRDVLFALGAVAAIVIGGLLAACALVWVIA